MSIPISNSKNKLVLKLVNDLKGSPDYPKWTGQGFLNILFKVPIHMANTLSWLRLYKDKE